jgi:hypothetical protein
LREQHGKLSGKITKTLLRVVLFIIFKNGLFHQCSLPQTQLTVLAELKFLRVIASISARFLGLKQLNISKFPFFGKTCTFSQCFGSGLDQDSIRSVDLDLESGSGYRRATVTNKNRNKFRNSVIEYEA